MSMTVTTTAPNQTLRDIPRAPTAPQVQVVKRPVSPPVLILPVPPERRVRLVEDAMRMRAREARMHENLDISAARAGNRQVAALVAEMRDVAGVADWQVEFDALDEGDLEGRAYAVAFLLFEIIEPALVERRDVRFLMWRQQARMIVPFFLRSHQHGPSFLRVVEIGIREARLFFKKSQDFEWFKKFVRSVLRKVAQGLDNECDEACVQMRKFLQEMQNQNAQALQSVRADLEAQDALIDALAEQVMQGAVEMHVLVDRIEQQQQGLGDIKESAMKMCQEMMQ